VSAPTLRPITDVDVDEVAALWLASFRSTGLPTPPGVTVDALAVRLLDREGWEVEVAERDGRIVAFLAYREQIRSLDELFVDPGAQGQGIGAGLLAAMKRRMSAGFSLYTDRDNAGARRFYARHGLVLVGEGLHPERGHPIARYAWAPGAE
jgi:ribosomal protein S18 acetylase RimI-like enzyme